MLREVKKGKQLEADQITRQDAPLEALEDIEDPLVFALPKEYVLKPRRVVIVVPTEANIEAIDVEVRTPSDNLGLADVVVYDPRLAHMVQIFGAMVRYDWGKLIPLTLKPDEVVP